MKRSTMRWSLAITAAAMLAVPAHGFAQTTTPPQTSTQSTSPSAQPSAEAQEHLRQARAALNDIKTANLNAQVRNDVNDLKRRLSALERSVGLNDSASATGQENRDPRATENRGKASWDTEVAAIDRTLTKLLGPASTTGATDPTATGTAGTTGATRPAANVKLDQESRAKLMELRTHITAFAAAMGGGQTGAAAPDPASTSATGTAATGATSGTASTGTTSPTTTGTMTQPPTQQTPETPTAQAQAPQVDEEAARRHLTEARNTLSALTQLPAAAQLTGEARMQISQLISNFNELITAQSEWRSSYAKVDANLTALLGPDSEVATAVTGSTGTGTTGTVGTSGEAALNLDPALREKLVELRRTLNAFEKAAGGENAGAGVSGAMTTGTAPTSPPAGTTTSGTATTGTAGTSTDPQTAGAPTAQTGTSDLMQHVAAIERLLAMQDEGGGLTLTKAQVEELRKHWTALRQSIEKR